MNKMGSNERRILGLKYGTILHWRVPFSFYLLPVFLLAFSLSPNVNGLDLLYSFLALHLFAYPASNAFNSYYDKDEGSIGGLEKPPAVEPELLWSALVLDGLGLGFAYFVNWEFFVALLIYGLVSKAYSHPSIRLKKRPFIGWLTVGIFQGVFSCLMAYSALQQTSWASIPEWLWIPATLSSIMLLGSYPMTQIYQHEEDKARGDITISILLGIRGTFLFTAIVFAFSTAGYAYFYSSYYHEYYALLFAVLLSPTLFFFLKWAFQAFKQPSKANFKNTMRLNLLSACCMNTFYLIFGLWEHGSSWVYWP